MKNIWMLFCFLAVSAASLLSQADAVAGSVTYFHNDISGSPLAATNESGVLLWKESYRPYGEKLIKAPESANNKIGFHGKEFDSETGLSYMGARYYDSAVGRFMGVDPLGFNPENFQSFNRYNYAGNNPYRFVDPDGHSPIDVAFLAYDLGKLGLALYTGVGVGGAVADVSLSVVGVLVPVPGAGQAMKAARAVDHVVDASSTASAASKVFAAEGKVKTYQSYTKEHLVTGDVYSGRASGYGTATENVAARDKGHHMNKEGYGPAAIDRSSTNAAAIRGREQMLIESNGNARSMGGNSGNKINGISQKNPKRENYIESAVREFGHIK